MERLISQDCLLVSMRETITTLPVDALGRVVIPKHIRDRLKIVPGKSQVEIAIREVFDEGDVQGEQAEPALA